MPNPTDPDVRFAQTADLPPGITGLEAGSSEPIFIVKFNNILYLTKVVWPYDPALREELERDHPTDPRIDAIKKIESLARGVDLPAFHVREPQIHGIIHGFAR